MMDTATIDGAVEEAIMLLQGALLQIGTCDQRYPMQHTDFVREHLELAEKYGDKRPPLADIKLHYITEKEVQHGRQ